VTRVGPLLVDRAVTAPEVTRSGDVSRHGHGVRPWGVQPDEQHFENITTSRGHTMGLSFHRNSDGTITGRNTDTGREYTPPPPPLPPG
jgi:hypothetical protein